MERGIVKSSPLVVFFFFFFVNVNNVNGKPGSTTA